MAKSPKEIEDERIAHAIKTIRIIGRSDVFRDNEAAWVALAEAEPDWSWGGNAHSLIHKEWLIDALRGNFGFDANNTLDPNCTVPGLGGYGEAQNMLYTLARLPDDVLIDLES